MSEPRALDHLLRHCGDLRPGETVLIVADARTAAIGDALAHVARRAGATVTRAYDDGARNHGDEPPTDVAQAMRGAQLIVGLRTQSMAHTHARSAASAGGARYLSLPEYSEELLEDAALAVDFRARYPLVRRFSDAFSAGSAVRVTTARGTDVALDIRGRIGNCCPGYVDAPGSLGSPPDIEANVSPVETGSNGYAVIDGSITHPNLGLLMEPVTLEIRGGRIAAFHGPAQTVAELQRIFADVGDERAYVLAECGVGLNDRAELTGIMLTDEGAAGCVHFGFGSNATVGGLNDVPFHLDFVMRSASLSIDGMPYLTDGEIAS
jgi:leucyl aminopeptidase (aminopeptidase T)